VLGPDVNESDLTFTVNKDGNIRFGLGGIKGVGEGAVEAIVEERKKNGKFNGFFDFIERVNLNSCNKKAIESLVLAGAFDGFTDIKREQFFVENSKGEVVMESIIRYGNKFQTDNALNQNSLFGGFDTIEIVKPEIPFAHDWSPLEKLNKEREYIGMYLSAHPLDEYEFEINYVCNAKTPDLKDLMPLMGKKLRIGGMVTAIRHGTSKAGNPYGIFTLEDYDGAHEFALFGNSYINFSKYMIKDLYLLIHATVQEKGADYKYRKVSDPNAPVVPEIKIQKIEVLNDVKDKLIDTLTVTIPLEQLDEEFALDMTDMVLEHKGTVNIYFNVVDLLTQHKVKLFARKCRVKINKDFYKMLKKYKDDGKLDFQVK
jgi:DNA polymerase III subunit alpha